jgi:hypothetical protein
VTPSTKRTATGAAEAWRSPIRTVTRISKQSIAALVNNITAEQGMWISTARFPELCQRHL